MCLPCVSTKLITMGKIFVCPETLLAAGCKPESICSELNHVLLRPLMVSLCIRPCPNTVSTIVGLSRQYLFVIVHVVFSTEAPNQLNVLNILSVCPSPENGAPFVSKVAASVFELTAHCRAVCQVAFLKSPITQCTAKCSHIGLILGIELGISLGFFRWWWRLKIESYFCRQSLQCLCGLWLLGQKFLLLRVFFRWLWQLIMNSFFGRTRN